MTNKREKGFTLLEVMISMLIFAVVLGGMVPIFIAHLKRNSFSEERSGAIGAAQIVLDELRLVDPTTLPTSGTTTAQNIAVNGKTYQVTVTYCENSSFCSSNNNRHLKVEAAYDGTTRYSTETVFTLLR